MTAILYILFSLKCIIKYDCNFIYYNKKKMIRKNRIIYNNIYNEYVEYEIINYWNKNKKYN